MENLSAKSYDWILDAIHSSNNPFHIECCKKLIELYVIKFNDTKGADALSYTLKLKENNINYI
jgi:hypothetical protein